MTEELCCETLADYLGDKVEVDGEDMTFCGVFINYCPFCGAPLRDRPLDQTFDVIDVNYKYQELEYVLQEYITQDGKTEERSTIKIKYPYEKVVQLDLDFICSLVNDE